MITFKQYEYLARTLKRADRIVLMSSIGDKYLHGSVTTQQYSYSRKPKGVWYAFGAKWLNLIASDKWSYREEYQNLDYYNAVYKLDLDLTNVLKLYSYQQMLDFTDQFEFKHDVTTYKKQLRKLKKKDPEGWGPVRLQSYIDMEQDTNFPHGVRLINWKEVAKHYSGIEINPWIPQAQNNPHVGWYYGWDVASGCVWDRRIIKKFIKIDLG